MLTRQGASALLGGIAALIVGRVFGVIELFVIGAAFVAATVAAVAFVRIRQPRVRASRWIHPSVLVAGDTGRVDLHLEHLGLVRSTTFELSETVRRANVPDHIARLPVAPLRPGTTSAAGYQLPTAVRGIIDLGPLVVETRDPLGIASRTAVVADIDQVTVAPRSYLLEMPQLGQGALGRHLLNQARRLGPGEFHSLREYIDGDEPRSIHWRASARSEDLMVKEHTVEGLRRCTVVFDADPNSYLDANSFERGVTAAASLVHSADHAALTTRFVTGGGIDLRGPDVSANTLRLLARIQPSDDPLGVLDRDPGEGLGLVVVITGSSRGTAWNAARSIVDPTLTSIRVTTDEPPRGAIAVGARTDEEFLDSWRGLTGRGRLDVVARSAPDDLIPEPV